MIDKAYEVIAKYYPGMNITQLGMTVAMIGAIRAFMGHEYASDTVDNYIHPTLLTDDVRQCLDFLEREVLNIKKSKIDIDFWKTGNKGAFRRDTDKAYRTLEGKAPIDKPIDNKSEGI